MQVAFLAFAHQPYNLSGDMRSEWWSGLPERRIVDIWYYGSRIDRYFANEHDCFYLYLYLLHVSESVMALAPRRKPYPEVHTDLTRR